MKNYERERERERERGREGERESRRSNVWLIFNQSTGDKKNCVKCFISGFSQNITPALGNNPLQPIDGGLMKQNYRSNQNMDDATKRILPIRFIPEDHNPLRERDIRLNSRQMHKKTNTVNQYYTKQ